MKNAPSPSASMAWACATLASLTLSACGGGGNTASVAPTLPAETTISAAAVVPYMNNSIAATSDTSAPVDINSTTLAADETSEPAPI